MAPTPHPYWWGSSPCGSNNTHMCPLPSVAPATERCKWASSQPIKRIQSPRILTQQSKYRVADSPVLRTNRRRVAESWRQRRLAGGVDAPPAVITALDVWRPGRGVRDRNTRAPFR
jgi:hypothetical protein